MKKLFFALLGLALAIVIAMGFRAVRTNPATDDSLNGLLARNGWDQTNYVLVDASEGKNVRTKVQIPNQSCQPVFQLSKEHGKPAAYFLWAIVSDTGVGGGFAVADTLPPGFGDQNISRTRFEQLLADYLHGKDHHLLPFCKIP